MALDRGRFTVLHLSDVHATTGEPLYGQVESLGRLAQVAEYAVSAGVTPEAVIVTGDLVERGHHAAYPEVNRELRALGATVAAPVFTVLGNHDGATEACGLDGHENRHYGVATVGPVRILTLDSSTGELDDAQLAWVEDTLAERFGMGTVVALHHPPVPSPLPTLAKAGLHRPERLARALAGTDTRVILSGHYHHQMTAQFAGVPLVVGPSLAYQQIMNAGPSAVSGYDHAMFSLVQLGADQVTTIPVSLRSPRALFTTPVPALTDVP